MPAHSTSFEAVVNRGDLVTVGNPHRRVVVPIEYSKDTHEMVQPPASAPGKHDVVVAIRKEQLERNLGISIVFVLLEGAYPLGRELREQPPIPKRVHVPDHHIRFDAGGKGVFQARIRRNDSPYSTTPFPQYRRRRTAPPGDNKTSHDASQLPTLA